MKNSFKIENPQSILRNNPTLFTQIVELDQQLEDQKWSSDSWQSALDSSRSFLIGIMTNEEDNLTGFVLFELVKLMGYAHLLKIVTCREHRQKGIGKELLLGCMEGLKGLEKIILEVEVDNSAAISLYTMFGFKVLHTHPKFYTNGADAHVMEKLL